MLVTVVQAGAHFAHKQLALLLAAMWAISTLHHVQPLQLTRTATSIPSIQNSAPPFAAPAAPVIEQTSTAHTEVKNRAVLLG
jgi:hypothetical protein